MKDLTALLAKHAPHAAVLHEKLEKKSDIVHAVLRFFSHIPEELTPQVS